MTPTRFDMMFADRKWAAVGAMILAAVIGRSSAQAGDIRVWEFGATVVEINDPDQDFGDVRLGDTINGDFAYDLDSTFTDGFGFTDYDGHPFEFHGIRLAIENPRTDEELRFEPSADVGYLVSVFTDDSYRAESAVSFWQGAASPLPDTNEQVFMDFAAQNLLSDTSLPTEYDLEDWPYATIYLHGAGRVNVVIAQIFAVEPVLPGDFDRDRDVDEDDYEVWRANYGRTGSLPADSTRDGLVGVADYTLWRDNLGATLPDDPVTSIPLPEPSAALLLILSAASLSVTRY